LAIPPLAEAGAILSAPQVIETVTRCAELLAGGQIKGGESGTRILRASRGGVAGEHAQGVLNNLAGELLDTTLAQFANPGMDSSTRRRTTKR
jgi:hypothetical protein